jgi:glycosyltransferase involved in cell wall biosynthesis
MSNKLILIGPKSRSDHKTTSGQAMMFQLLIDELIIETCNFFVVDISETFKITKSRKSGSFDIYRIVEYIYHFLLFIKILIFHPRDTIYITISQSLPGFLRDFIFISISKIFNLRIIAHQFGGNFNNFYINQHTLIKILIKFTYKRIDKIIVEGNFSKSNFSFLENDFNNILVIPNGLPERNLANSGSKIYSKSEPFRILYLSNLILSKGYFDVLKAVNILVNKKRLNISCSFVGKFITAIDDPKNTTISNCQSAFFDYIFKHDLKNSVSYSESKFDAEKQDEFKKANVFVLPSYYINEGQPVSVLEAMSYGVVPILTKYRLMPQMITENSGYFIEPKNPESIVQKIEFLINNTETYASNSKNTIKYFKDNFTSEIYLNKLLKILYNEQ